MSGAQVPICIGARVIYDGRIGEVVAFGTDRGAVLAVVRIPSNNSLVRIALGELKEGGLASVVPDSPDSLSSEDSDNADLAGVALLSLSDIERERVLDRAAHIREVLTGYRSGLKEFPAPGEPRPDYDPRRPRIARYTAKAAELSVSRRTVQQWVADYEACGEAGLVPKRGSMSRDPFGRTDRRWVEVALEVMVEHVDLSRPSAAMVIERANARVVARYGADVVALPGRSTAYRVLDELEQRQPLFRLSTKRNRDIADRPQTTYGKLRPTRPGEYLLMDTTTLDVFALDPMTLEWVQAQLTVAMDWYSRCIVGIRVTPVSTKAVDAAATLYQVFRPPPVGKDWPAHAVWPDPGIPRWVLLDDKAINGPMVDAAHPALVPETVVIDHGKIFVSAHLTSVCRRMGISIQPARLRTGRDKGPVERFFRTLREDLLQILPGYKGPDLHSRGLNPEMDAFFYLNEIESKIREWVASVYHHRPHDGLVEPYLPKLDLSPAMMFEHGIARAGYVEVPRDPDLAKEFLKPEIRSIQHYGVQWDYRIYRDLPEAERDESAPTLADCEQRVMWNQGKRCRGIAIHVNPDDITRIYTKDRRGRWVTLVWEHAASLNMPMSVDAMAFARRLAAAKYTYPNDKLAAADLFERWNLGLGQSRAERRMALRLARNQAALLEMTTAVPDPDASQIPSGQTLSVATVIDANRASTTPPNAGDDDSAPEGGDTDTIDDDDLYEFPDDDLDDFYADAVEDV
ncbi:helix-turn-helix domain-containing protein [Nocardia sp. NPDC056611]|uniref:helix-turn-helix domain-containing protein n=1 Tax=Nocardia sp. NPDC056611 TaxID=3345877 RepID=UPI00366F2373